MTKGNPTRLLLSFTMPMLVGNLFQQFYNIVDSIIVGQFVGADALAAVGATGSVNFLIFSLCFGMAAGVGIVISQYFGAKDEEYVKRAIVNAMYLLLASAAVMFVVGFGFARPFLIALHTPDNILGDAVLYMKVICCGIFTVAVYNGVSSILRALGDSKTPLVFLVISSFLNIALDLIFILTFHWGVFGAGFATVLSEGISGIGCLIWALRKNPYFKFRKDYMRVDTSIIKKCSRLGFPVAIQNAMIAVSCIALQSVVNTFGSTVVAAFTVTSRVEQIVQQPYGSLGTAMSTYAGQNMGACESRIPQELSDHGRVHAADASDGTVFRTSDRTALRKEFRDGSDRTRHTGTAHHKLVLFPAWHDLYYQRSFEWRGRCDVFADQRHHGDVRKNRTCKTAYHDRCDRGMGRLACNRAYLAYHRTDQSVSLSAGKMERKRCGRACPERKTACGCIKERKRTWKISCLLPFYLSCKYFARKELGVSFRYFKKQRLNVEILANPDISATSVMESVALASSSQARFKRSFVINST